MARKKKDSAAVSPFARRYLDLLGGEGYRPAHARQGDRWEAIRFKREGETFILFVDGEDEGFFHLAAGFDLGGADAADAIRLANDLNDEVSGVKVTVHPEEDSVRFHVEALLDGPASYAFLDRAVDAVRGTAALFFRAGRPTDQLDA